MGRFRGILLLAVAGLLALGTALLVRGAVQGVHASSEQLRVAAPQTRVLVAAANLSMGRFVRATDLVWQPWPESGIAATYIVEGKGTTDGFVGAVVRSPVATGEPITSARVVRPGDQGFLAAVLTPGHRAVSVQINATTGISGFVFPGDRVDLIMTHVLPRKQTDVSGEQRASETVLTDIRVIAIDQTTEEPGDAKAVVAKTATLEATPKQVEIIALVSEIGKLSLSLRSLAVETPDGTPTADAADGGQRRSYTRDSDVSPLLYGTGAPAVTLLRAGKTEEVAFAGGHP